jgi:hypothetical protein
MRNRFNCRRQKKPKFYLTCVGGNLNGCEAAIHKHRPAGLSEQPRDRPLPARSFTPDCQAVARPDRVLAIRCGSGNPTFSAPIHRIYGLPTLPLRRGFVKP